MRMSGRRLAELIRRFAGVRVLVVGDLMLDRFVWGRVERISPEAPVPVVHVTGEDERPGGAGNVVSNVAALGGRAAACGIVGDDAAGKRLVAALAALGAGTEGIVVSRHARTTQKTRIIAHHQQVLRADEESREALSSTVAEELSPSDLADLMVSGVVANVFSIRTRTNPPVIVGRAIMRMVWLVKGVGERPCGEKPHAATHCALSFFASELRSEERRVGKECRSRWSPYH